MSVRHGTANLCKENSGTQVAADLARLAPLVDVLGVQEVETSGHRAAVKARTKKGWTVYWPGGDTFLSRSENAVPILWRSDRFTLVASGKERTFAGKRGLSPARWIVWAVLRDRLDGSHVVRVNTHLIQQAFTSHPGNRRIWEHHAARLDLRCRILVSTYPDAQIVAGGDFNRSHWLGLVGTELWANHGTYGSAYYDYLVVQHGRGSGVTRVPINSDHDALVATVTTAGKPAPAKPKPTPKPAPKPPEAPVSTAQKVIAAAHHEVGYREGFSGGHWNNAEKYAGQVPGLAWANYQPWCDTFVAWCFGQAGVLNLLPGGPTASVAASRDRWRNAKRFSEYPAVGAQVIYGTHGDAHTGIVVAYGPTTITTVEGNTNADGSPEGNGVYLKTHNRRDRFVYGYGYPAYPEGIDSADPAWAHAKPKPVPAKPPASHKPASTARGTELDIAIAALGKVTRRDALATAKQAHDLLLTIPPLGGKPLGGKPPKTWRGTQIEDAIAALSKSRRPSQAAPVKQALTLLRSIPPLGGK